LTFGGSRHRAHVAVFLWLSQWLSTNVRHGSHALRKHRVCVLRAYYLRRIYFLRDLWTSVAGSSTYIRAVAARLWRTLFNAGVRTVVRHCHHIPPYRTCRAFEFHTFLRPPTCTALRGRFYQREHADYRREGRACL